MPRPRIQDGPPQLRAAALAMRRLDGTTLGDVYVRLQRTLSPEWTSLLAQHLTGIPQENTLMPGARVKAGNPPALVAADSSTRIGRDMIPTTDWPWWEYGAGDNEKRTYERRNRKQPGTHKVTRDTRAQLPRYRKGGRVIGPTVTMFLPRAAAFWVQSTIRGFMDAADRKS